MADAITDLTKVLLKCRAMHIFHAISLLARKMMLIWSLNDFHLEICNGKRWKGKQIIELKVVGDTGFEPVTSTVWR